MSESELNALISLLDDPDAHIYDEIRSKLIAYGDQVIPHLEHAWENSFDHLLQSRIENIIHQLQFSSIQKELSDWKATPDHNLIEGALIIAKYQYPDIDYQKIKAYVQQLKQDVWLELNDNLTALEKVKVLNRILFDIHGLYGNTKNINSPQNSYLNNVVETKKGNPISLGIIYLAICQMLDIPIYGVDIPAHFILAYSENGEDALFYLNVFNKGSVFGKHDIDRFLKQLDKKPKDSYYRPCDNLTVIKRLLQHLIYSYDNLGYLDKKEELEALYKLL
ncbi:MAG: transglutaminase family protein [Flavobacteriales bacterium]|nr:transglutaminase family protein [Flavobacteriales bacterium]